MFFEHHFHLKLAFQKLWFDLKTLWSVTKIIKKGEKISKNVYSTPSQSEYLLNYKIPPKKNKIGLAPAASLFEKKCINC